MFDPLGIEGVFVASAVEEFDAIVWGNAQRYDPRWVYHGCVVGSLSWAASCLHRLMHGDLLAPATKSAMLCHGVTMLTQTRQKISATVSG